MSVTRGLRLDMKKITTFIKKRKIWSMGLLIILVLASYLYWNSQKNEPAKFFTVTHGEVVSLVNVTGKVKPTRSLDLAFEKSGRIQKIDVKVGDRVSEGRLLISLDNNDLYAQLLQAQASVKAEKATLDQLMVGTRIEDIRIKQSELDKAKQDLANYYSSVPAILNDSYTKANDAVRQQTDPMFINSEQVNPQLIFQTTNAQLQTDVQFDRRLVSSELNTWRFESDQIQPNSPFSDLDKYIKSAEYHLAVIRTFLNKTLEAVQNSTLLSQAAVTTYKTNINTALTEANTALTNITDQEQAIASQKVTVEKIQNELNLQLAGTLPEQIEAQKAKVEQAQANVSYYASQIAKTILKAPFDGVVTKVNLDPGDIPSANESVVSLVGKGVYEIEANIAESDIAKVKIGNKAKVTLDAYGPDLVFAAKVAQIDLSSTVLEGVATYKTTLQFLSEDSRILAGLTANVDILNEKKENVLYAPTRDIFAENSHKFVNLLENEKENIVQKVEVKTGLRGSDGRTEIISGLNEGDKIVVD